MKIPDRLQRFWLAVKPWLVIRLRQPSTYAGLVMKTAGIAGFVVTDTTVAHIAEVIAVIAGAALVAWDQTPKSDPSDGAGA